MRVDQRLRLPTFTTESGGATGIDRYGSQAVGGPSYSRLLLVETDPRQFRIYEDAVGNEPVHRRLWPPFKFREWWQSRPPIHA